MRQTRDQLDAADREFLSAFENCVIPAADFRHRDHVRVAYIYLTLHDADTALAKTRSGLQRFLAHVGAPASKYHETITRAWLLAVEHFMQTCGSPGSFEQFAAAAPRLFAQGAMETHYTAELLGSEAARQQFVAPDLEPISSRRSAARRTLD